MSKKDDTAKKKPAQAVTIITETQLGLFSFDVPEHYSNVVQLYHEIPKYVCDAPRDQKYLDSLSREFVVDKVKYRVVLHPARLEVKGEDGQKITKEFFVGIREELVEDAITKIAIDKQRLFILLDTTRISFTIRDVQNELKRTNHLYSYEEIKEAIQVLAGARMVIEEVGGEGQWGTSTYPEFMLSTDSKTGEGFVQLHPLMAEGIKRGLYSQYDYSLAMALPGRYSRRLYKLLAAKFTWARATGDPFTLHLVAFLERHGFKVYERITDNAKQFRQCLEALKAAKILMSWEEEPKKKGRKIVDFKYSFRPTPEFSIAMRRAQGIKNEIAGKLAKEVQEDT